MEERKFFGLRKNVFVVGLVSLFMDISSEMVYPLVPLFLTGVLGTTVATVGVIEGIAESTASILKVFSGWVADRFGRHKLLMLIGYSTSTLSRGVLGVAGSWGDVLGARFIDRVGKGVRAAPRDAIIADSADKETLGRAFGFHRAMDSVGAMIGPALAALLLAVFTGNMRLVFLLSIIPGAIAVFLIAAFVREKARSVKTGEKARLLDPYDPPDNGELRRYIIAIALFSLGNTSDAFLILRAGSLGIPAGMIPVVYLSMNAVYAASSVPLGVFADRVGLKNMVLGGFFFYSAIYMGFAFATGWYHIVMLFVLYGLFKGMSDGSQRAYLARISAPEKYATAFGIFHTSAGIMLFPASAIGGVLWDAAGPASTFLYGSILALVAALIFAIPASQAKKNQLK